MTTGTNAEVAEQAAQEAMAARPGEGIQTIPVLSETAVKAAITVEDALREIEAAFAEYGHGRVVLSDPPASTLIPGAPYAAFKTKAAHLGGRGITGCRFIADAMRDGREVTTDYCWVSDAVTGRPLGLVSETWLHRLRTAGTGVVAARLMARPDSRIATIVGAGNIAEELPALLRAAFTLDEIRIVSRRMSSAQAFAARHDAPDTPVRAFSSIDEAVDGADLVMAISAAESPVLNATHAAPGRFICGMGGGAEIAWDILERTDRFVVDDLDYACMIGSVHGWVGAGTPHAEIAARLEADIGEIATGAKPARRRDEDAILAIIQGMACCDVALSHLALKRAGLLPVEAGQ